jgi:hypothetical protein
MELVVDLDTSRVAVEQFDDLRSLSVAIQTEEHGDDISEEAIGILSAIFSTGEVGTVGPSGDTFIRPEVLRRLASDAAARRGKSIGSEWDDEFAAMVAYASSKGWISEDGSIQAHIKWSES